MAARLDRRRLLHGASLLAALPLLGSCGLFSRPAPQPPTPTPTPTPTPPPTPTRAVVRSDTPPSPATVVAVSGTPAPAPTVNVAPRGVGQLLYTGSLGGTAGIILADLADGGRKLLVAGNYQYPTWAPDGARRARRSAPTADLPIQQVAVFAADGRALARFSLPISPQISPRLLWSPSSRHLVYQVSDPVAGGLNAWIIDEAGQRPLALPPGAFIWHWLPDGRITYTVPLLRDTPPSADAQTAIWTIDPQGGAARREMVGAFYPFGLSPDGATIYAVGGFRTTLAAGQQAVGVTTIVALDLSGGMIRTVLDLTAVSAGESAWIENAAVAPSTGLLAVCRATIPIGAQQNAVGAVNDLLILDAAGREVARDLPWQNNSGLRWINWSPHGLHVAYHAQVADGGSELRALHGGIERAVYPVRAADPRTGLLAAWSSDDRWLAYVDAAPTGLVIAEAGKPPALPFAADGNFPAWRPWT